jgi:hypothetical protein
MAVHAVHYGNIKAREYMEALIKSTSYVIQLYSDWGLDTSDLQSERRSAAVASHLVHKAAMTAEGALKPNA